MKIEESVARGDIISSEEVYVEIAKKDDDLFEWMKRRTSMLVPAEEMIQRRMLSILESYPRLVDTLKGRSQADPFVIATALETSSIVVTGESFGTATKPRIPFVSEALGLRSIDFLQMIREMSLTF